MSSYDNKKSENFYFFNNHQSFKFFNSRISYWSFAENHFSNVLISK